MKNRVDDFYKNAQRLKENIEHTKQQLRDLEREHQERLFAYRIASVNRVLEYIDYQARIFEKYHLHKLTFFVVIGNPIERSYDRMIAKFGGRIVGTYRKDTRLIDGKYYDRKAYEVLAEDYFTSPGYHALRRKYNE